MQKIRTGDFRTNIEPEREEEDKPDAGEESELQEWEKEAAHAWSVEEMAEAIRRTPL